MPKFEAKQIQKDLDQGHFWPLYWLYGGEGLKSRELLKRIQASVLGGDEKAKNDFGLNQESFEGGESQASDIVDAAQTMSLGGGRRLIVVREAHLLKGPEALESQMGPPASDLPTVIVCLSKDLDARKKFSKKLIEKAAVVSCEVVPEAERAPWIQYLAKRKGLSVAPEILASLERLDPFSLDGVERELEKMEAALPEDSAQVLVLGVQEEGPDALIDALLSKNRVVASQRAAQMGGDADQVFPFLGLLGWTVRQLWSVVSDRENGTRYAKLNPYVAVKLERWARQWNLKEVLRLEKELAQIDFDLKQTPKLPSALLETLVILFC